ncbi:MAG: FAD-dependent oxidoreductase [Myxococcales bacterium]|nr:FAD-dependent oxidoreductase [Myxococcales bacterium]
MSRASNVVVVGGGAVGCAVAYYAAKRGLDVTLVDTPKRGRASSASAGGTWPLGESLGLGCGIIFYKTLMKRGGLAKDGIGPEQLPDCFLDFSMASNAMFPNLHSELKELGGVDFEFEETTLLFVMLDEADATFAKMLLEKFPRDKALLRWLEREELVREEPAVRKDNCGALQFLPDHQVNPYRFADSLRAAGRALGVRVVSHTEVTGIRVEGERVVAVEATDEVFPCEVVVNAAGAWAAEVGRMVGLKLPVHPVRGQIVCTETLPEILRACLSTSDCYIAQKGHGEIIVGSTTEEVGFDVRVTPEALRQLCAGAVRTLPFLKDVRVKRVWAGLRPGSPDELPILGPVAGLCGYYNACGHFRTGILNAPLTGKLITEMICGEPLSFDCQPFLFSRFDTEPALQPSRKLRERPSPISNRVGSVGYSGKRYDGFLDMSALVDGSERVSLQAGHTVVREGEEGDRFYVVAKGRVNVLKGEVKVVQLGPGEFFGEMALLEQRRRSATVVTDGPCELMVVERDKFDDLLAHHPEMASTILRVMASRLRAAISDR